MDYLLKLAIAGARRAAALGTGTTRSAPWDELQAASFAGEANWNYCVAPFLFVRGFQHAAQPAAPASDQPACGCLAVAAGAMLGGMMSYYRAWENRRFVRGLLKEKQPEFAAALESVVQELGASSPLSVEDLAYTQDPVPQGVPEAPGSPDPPRYFVPTRSGSG